jgi:hypothetical protein
VRYLGADTPTTDLAFACGRIDPDLVVVATSRSTALLGAGQGLRRIAARYPVAIAGGVPHASWPRSSASSGCRVT